MDREDHILIVDDDLEIRTLLRDYLHKHGYRATAVPDGKALRDHLQRTQVDLIILDIMLPGEDGLSLCRDLRTRHDVPVIMLTALGETTERIVGLEMGADDYVTKPFDPRELLARIKVVLRRTRSLPRTAPGDGDLRRLRFLGWTLDTTARHLLSPEGVVVSLSGGEYRLLKALIDHPNRVLSRDQLLEMTRGREAGPFDRSIDVQIGRLRRHLGDDGKEPRIIKTVRGAGYVLAASVTEIP